MLPPSAETGKNIFAVLRASVGAYKAPNTPPYKWSQQTDNMLQLKPSFPVKIKNYAFIMNPLERAVAGFMARQLGCQPDRVIGVGMCAGRGGGLWRICNGYPASGLTTAPARIGLPRKRGYASRAAVQ